MSWCCYLLKCTYSNVTYVGITNDLNRRLKQHNGVLSGGAKFTRGRSWKVYAYLSGFENKSTAASMEWKIKHSGKTGINKIKTMEEIANNEENVSLHLCEND